jgi:hypothetical protein
MLVVAMLLIAVEPLQSQEAPNLDTNICLGPCPVLPDPNLRPLAFVAGSCWRTEVSGRADTSCFTWMFGGHFLRERERDFRGVSTGETIYHWDPGTRRIRWTHYSLHGLLGSGSVAGTGYGVAFAFQSLDFGRPIPARVTWRREGANSYVETTWLRERGRWHIQSNPPRYRRTGPAPPD